MKIQILCIGKLKERYWREAAAEYCKRLAPYCSLTVNELSEVRLSGKGRAAEEENVKKTEGVAILRQVADSDYVIALDVAGKPLSSEAFAEKLEALSLGSPKRVVMIIGGSLGLSDEVLRRADFRLSFSEMTFPHQMMRVILLEQLYRSYKIMKNESYHK